MKSSICFSSNSEESLKKWLKCLFDVYSEIHEHADGNWLFRAISRGLTGEPWFYDKLRAVIVQHIEDYSNQYKIIIVENLKTVFQKWVEMEFRVEIVKFKHLVRFTV